MESVLPLSSHTNSDLRYCAEEIKQPVDDVLKTAEVAFLSFSADYVE